MRMAYSVWVSVTSKVTVSAKMPKKGVSCLKGPSEEEVWKLSRF